MADLEYEGKEVVSTYHLTIPYHTLNAVKRKSTRPDEDTPDVTRNSIIHGDNLLVLKSLMPSVGNMVDCVYIDPPYNTGKRWKYSDNINDPVFQEWFDTSVGLDDMERHDKWLCMMKPRLELLRALLKDTGSIFVSIDDNEVHHLRMLMADVFGEENFLAMICWQGMDTRNSQTPHFSANVEYILAFAKNKEELVLRGERKSERQFKNYINPDDDPRGPYLPTPIHARGEGKNYEYVFANGQRWTAPADRHPRFTKAKLRQLEKDGEILLDPAGKNVPQRKTYLSEVSERMPPTTFWPYQDYGSTRQSNKELRDLLGRNVFSDPKPVKLVKSILDIAAGPDALVLDAFAGSGTTGQAVLELNQADGGSRRFILIEQEDYAHTITAKRIKQVAASLPQGSGEALPAPDFCYWELGEPLDDQACFTPGKLPSYDKLAAYVFFLSTGQAWQPGKKKGNFIGNTDKHDIFLYYVPNMKKLSDMKFTRDEAAALPQVSSRARVVFAPARYVDLSILARMNIRYCQLPWEVFNLQGR